MEAGTTYLERAKALGPAISAAANEIDAIRDIPEPLFEELVKLDMFRLLQPRNYGGAELTPLEFTRVIEEIGKHDASVGWCLCQNNVCAAISALLTPSGATKIFNSPRDILAWGPGPGEAHAVAGGYQLSGKFNFASGSRHATYLGAHVPVFEPDGTRRKTADGLPQILTMLFPRSNAQVHDTWHVIGLKGTGSDSFDVDDLFVADEHAVSRSAASMRHVDGKLYLFSQSNLYSSGFASLALGLARATLTDFIEIVRDTVPRGAPKPRQDNNVVQSSVGQAEARIRSSRAFLRNTLNELWHHAQQTGPLTDDQQLTLRLATTWAIQQSREVITSLYLAAGALSIFETQPFEHRFRDIHTLCQQIQGHAAHFETVGQILMGMEPDRSMFTF